MSSLTLSTAQIRKKSFENSVDPDESMSCLIRVYTVCLFLFCHYSAILFSIFVYVKTLFDIMDTFFFRRKRPLQTLIGESFNTA